MRRLVSLLLVLLVAGCFPYVYHEQNRVLIEGIDVGATLEIARTELEEGGFDATLPVWAIRDQVVSEGEARTIAELYSTYIDRIAAEPDRGTAEFGVWHFAWAISNLYRNLHNEAQALEGVKRQLESAYLDAQKRPETLKQFKGVAAEHVNGSKIYMGDIHGAARSFARAHIVAPGNECYLQSLDDFSRNKDEDDR